MKIQIFTTDGVSERELSAEELIDAALHGSMEAKREIFRKEYGTAKSIGAKLEAIAKRLG